MLMGKKGWCFCQKQDIFLLTCYYIKKQNVLFIIKNHFKKDNHLLLEVPSILSPYSAKVY